MLEEIDSTKDKIASSFRELVISKAFNKITIKDITDGAQVIRPTFYNYFRDKNEVFDYILDEELFDALDDLVQVGLFSEAISFIFTYFDRNRAFYKKAFQTEGQNSFEEILTHKMIDFLDEIFEELPLRDLEELSIFGLSSLTHYYAMVTVLFIKIWLLKTSGEGYDLDDVIRAYKFLATHSVYDLIDTEELDS